MRALQRRGEVVAVTGDGVNDVPALQAADIGVAMGERGTKAAREAAHIVPLNDAFSTIVDAVEEGARLYGNLRASFTYLLALHLPVFLTAAIVPLAGLPLLYEPVHIVWLESLIHPTAYLAFSAASAGRAARGHASQLFSRPELVRIVASAPLWVRAPGGAAPALRAPATPDLLSPTPSPARTPRG